MVQFRDRNDFAPTIEAAAERLRISAAIVEKDYWVTEVLRALARGYRANFIFKGGTSLSKGYGIIERFSEDVDILIIPGDRASNATHRLMKSMASAAESILGGPAEVLSSSTGVHRDVRVGYRTTRERGNAIRPEVRLEAGIRGSREPSEPCSIGCLLGDTLQAAGTSISDFEDLQPFEVEVLHPGRTLLEKLGLVHSALGAAPEVELARKHARHYYDIYQLLAEGRVLTLLDDRSQFDRVLQSMREINSTYYPEAGEIRPAGGWAASPAFDPAGQSYDRLREAYDATMTELYLGDHDPPAFTDICARVAERGHLL